MIAGAVILTLATIAGAWVGLSGSPVPEEVTRARLLERVDAVPSAIFFIRHNLLVSLFVLCGCVTFGLTAIVGLITTGVTMGSAIAAGLNNGLPITAVLTSLAPHGVFEIPALVIAGGVGLIGLRSFVAVYHDRPAIQIDRRVLATTTLLVVVLIVIAGLVEAHVTPDLVAGALSVEVIK
jgi:uncharacterized membrane protein SpoIIM required for sporulation